MSRRAPESVASAFGGLKASYNAATPSRFRRKRTGVSPVGSSGDYHYRSESDYLRMMEYARDMDRNDAIVGQMVDRAVLNTVQNGLVPDPQTGDPEVDKILAALWSDWASDPMLCDAMGEMTFCDIQEQVLRATFVDGDICALPLVDGTLQLVEGHRLRTPTNTSRNVVHGVLLDDDRRREEYWFTRDDIDPNVTLTRVGDIEPYPAFDGAGNPLVFHVMMPKRVSQTRGVTAFAPAFDMLGMFEDINFAKLVQQQVVSCIAFIRNREQGAPVPGQTPPAYGDQTVETMADGAKRLIDEIAPGIEITAAPGETIEGFSPNVPNSEFFQHAKLILTLIGVNLGLPLVMVTMDASDTNFSGWRGAVDQARMGFKRNQRWLQDRFLRKVYRWKVRQWRETDPSLMKAAAKLESENGDIFRHVWNTPRWPYIQPLQDAQADVVRLEKGLVSPRRLQAERGYDYEQIVEERISDNGRLIRRAIAERDAIFEETGVEVDWHECATIAATNPVSLAGIADEADERTQIGGSA